MVLVFSAVKRIKCPHLIWLKSHMLLLQERLRKSFYPSFYTPEVERKLDPEMLNKFPGIRPENYQIPENLRVGVQEFTAGLMSDSDFDGDTEEDLENSRKLLMQVRASRYALSTRS